MANPVIVVYSTPSDPAREEEYNHWYDTMHLPDVCDTPGVVSARRFRIGPAQVLPADDQQAPVYLAVYELDGLDTESTLKELRRRFEAGVFRPSDAFSELPGPPPGGSVVYEEIASYP